MRYVVMPYSYYTDGVVNTFLNISGDLDKGLILMLWELVIVFMFLEITGKRYLIKFKKKDATDHQVRKDIALSLSEGLVPLILVGIIIVYIAFFHKSLNQGLDVFLSGSYNEFDEIDSLIDEGQGYINIVWQTLCVWVYFFLVKIEKTKYDVVPRKIHAINSILFTVIFVLITFIDGTGLTRWYTLVTALTCLACLLYMFPSHKKNISISIVVPLVIIMVLSSLIKNAGFVLGQDSAEDSAKDLISATNMDVYFNGLGNVSTVFYVDKFNNIGIESLFVDALNSMPIIGKSLPKEKKTSAVFQKALGRSDQIIPLLAQGYLYFGFLFAPLLSIICILLFRKADYKFCYNHSYTKYSWAIMAIWFSAIPSCLNWNIAFMWMYIRILPFFLVLWLTNLITQSRFKRVR